MDHVKICNNYGKHIQGVRSLPLTSQSQIQLKEKREILIRISLSTQLVLEVRRKHHPKKEVKNIWLPAGPSEDELPITYNNETHTPPTGCITRGSDGFLKVQIILTNPGCFPQARHCFLSGAEGNSSSPLLFSLLVPHHIRAKSLSEFAAVKRDS